MTTQNRVLSGIPTGGQFATHDRSDGVVDLRHGIDTDLRAELVALQQSGEGIFVSMNTQDDPNIAGLAPGCDSVAVRIGRAGRFYGVASFGSVDMIRWSANVQNLDLALGDEEEALDFLNAHQSAIDDFFDKRGIEFPTDREWDDSELLVKVPLDADEGITFAEAAGKLGEEPTFHFVREGLTDRNSAMSKGLLAACRAQRP
jgi:hypothetical protein